MNYPDQLAFLAEKRTSDFIKVNLNSDPQKLILNPPESIRGNEKLVAEQIISRKKGKTKLPWLISQSGLLMPPPLSVEQSSSEETARFKASLVKGGHLVDLTGGMGVDTIFMSEFFENCTYVDENEWLCQIFSHNAGILEKDIEIVNARSEDFIKNLRSTDNLTFYIDPARRDHHKNKVIRFSDCSPNVVELKDELLAKGNRLLIKASPMMDIKVAIHELGFVSQINVVAVKNEVKELLLEISNDSTLNDQIRCFNLADGNVVEFSFNPAEEKSENINYSSQGEYIFDPNSAISKAGAFNTVARRFGLKKFAPNTHLYLSDEFNEELPGRVFQIKTEIKSVKELKNRENLHVISKNSPLIPNELSKRYNWKESGEDYLICIRDAQSKSRIFLTRRLK